MHRFVALDLELTPLPGNRHRIIEVAAVRCAGAVVMDRFSSLVNPRCEISRRIECLTGISRKDVLDAPLLETVVPDLLNFLGDDPLVGQSIDLDLERLAEEGVRPRNAAYDTFELASLLLPGLASYDLHSIARHLGVALEVEHRALGDALVTARVFTRLMERISGLSLDVLTSIDSLAEAVPQWPYRLILREALRARLKRALVSPETGPHSRPAEGEFQAASGSTILAGIDCPSTDASSTPEGHSRQFSAAPRGTPPATDDGILAGVCRSILAAGGAVESALRGFEERDEQLRMTEAVAAALETGEHLMVEAGTGTGKSLAYLVPALFVAMKSGEPVVISTNTLNLQDQLFQHDIPLLRDCVPFEFEAALLKGRRNYLCLRRWLALTRSPDLSPEEALLLIKVVVWLAETGTGDRSELNLSGPEAATWSKVSAQAESCAFAKCQHFRRGSCFVMRARRGAAKAQLVVVNHALLLSDLGARGGVLPQYSRLIVDEAHHLEAEATEQLGFTLDRSDLTGFLASVSQSASDRRGAGFVPELIAALHQPAIDDATFARLRETADAAASACEGAATEARSFFESLRCFIQDQSSDRYQQASRLRITQSVRIQPGWSEIEVAWSALSRELQKLRSALRQIHQAVALMDEQHLSDGDGVLADLAGLLAFLDEARAQGTEAICSPSHNGVYWIESGGSLGDLAIRSAPLHVGAALNDALFANKESVVLTSATMTTEGSFEYMKERLGLEEADELQVGSPFNYKDSTLLYVARDMPEPARPNYQRAVETAIMDLALAMEGRTLVLFTSHSQLRTTAAAIRGQMEEQGLMLLAHGIDGSRRKLLQAFQASPRAVLMGTSSFWEGIDVVGPALSCLVIVKLPFSVPSDPIFAARSEGFEEPFRQYSVPQTILRFKQGFGRLIRSRSDRGVVAILDSRIGSKFYGPAFVQSLPACTTRYGAASEAGAAARSWLGEERSPADSGVRSAGTQADSILGNSASYRR